MFLPCPELGADEEDHRDVQAVKLAGKAEVDIGKVDQNRSVGKSRLSAQTALELAVLTIDAGHVADDFGDAHDGDVFGANDAAETGGFHPLAAKAEEGRIGRKLADGVNQRRAVVLPTGFTGREKDERNRRSLLLHLRVDHFSGVTAGHEGARSAVSVGADQRGCVKAKRRELLVFVLELVELVVEAAPGEQFLMTAHSRSWPLCMTRMTSARCTVESRCAMTTEVRPSTMRSSAERTRSSVSVSTLEVASSRIRILGSWASARAKLISCFASGGESCAALADSFAEAVGQLFDVVEQVHVFRSLASFVRR